MIIHSNWTKTINIILPTCLQGNYRDSLGDFSNSCTSHGEFWIEVKEIVTTIPWSEGDWWLISKSVGADTEGNSWLSANQTGGFCVCTSSFFVHLTNFLFREWQNEPSFWKFRLEVVVLGYIVSDEPTRVREKCYQLVWLILIYSLFYRVIEPYASSQTIYNN